MAWTEDDLALIDKALVRNWRRVRFADKEMEFGNNAELWATRREIVSALNKESGSPRRRVIRLFGSVD